MGAGAGAPQRRAAEGGARHPEEPGRAARARVRAVAARSAAWGVVGGRAAGAGRRRGRRGGRRDMPGLALAHGGVWISTHSAGLSSHPPKVWWNRGWGRAGGGGRVGHSTRGGAGVETWGLGRGTKRGGWRRGEGRFPPPSLASVCTRGWRAEGKGGPRVTLPRRRRARRRRRSRRAPAGARRAPPAARCASAATARRPRSTAPAPAARR
jgi:hypothetical protein